MTPKRVQLSRKRGSRLPPNTVNVARPSKWGNPYRVAPVKPGERGVGARYEVIDPDGEHVECFASLRAARSCAVSRFRCHIQTGDGELINHYVVAVRRDLHGKNLACWCPADQPCHADVLLAVANEATP